MKTLVPSLIFLGKVRSLTLEWSYVMPAIGRHSQARPSLELKTPVSSGLSMYPICVVLPKVAKASNSGSFANKLYECHGQTSAHRTNPGLSFQL
jgi:hypothetical protein